jgi:hypothetical protein
LQAKVDAAFDRAYSSSPMSSLALSLLVFALVSSGAVAGIVLRERLPKHHLSDASQSVVKLGIGLIATIAALVLGLLIASANSTYNSDRAQITQMRAQVILLDRLLAGYGSEAIEIRAGLRQEIGAVVTRIWQEESSEALKAGPFVPNTDAEALYGQIRLLVPKNDLQRSLQEQALTLFAQLAQTRLMLFAQSTATFPAPFLVVLVFWLVIIFFSFALPAPPNLTMLGVLFTCALSASAAIFLILEMGDPFSGLMKIPSAPLLAALPPLS